jgi:hypothetical protein
MSDMKKKFIICLSLIILSLVLVASACSSAPASTTPSPAVHPEPNQIAENFIRSEATFVFDGITDTLELASTSLLPYGGIFTYKFDSAHAGYGDRTGQMLAQVITPHIAVIIVENGKVTSAIMDEYWNMVSRQLMEDIEITLTPIESVTVNLLKSNPAQVSVHIIGGLPSGCTTFHNAEITREGTTVTIKVTNQQPKGKFCPAIYTTFEKDINLGTDFEITRTYTLKVNDYTTIFQY